MKFIIMKSAFGDFWIGKTNLALPEHAKSFDLFGDAKEEAMALCTQCEDRDELEFMEEDEIEDIVNKEMWKWLA